MSEIRVKLSDELARLAEAGGGRVPRRAVERMPDMPVKCWKLMEWRPAARGFVTCGMSMDVPADGVVRPSAESLARLKETLPVFSGRVSVGAGRIHCLLEKPAKVHGWERCFMAEIPAGVLYAVSEDGKEACAAEVRITDPRFFSALKSGDPGTAPGFWVDPDTGVRLDENRKGGRRRK